MADNDRETYDPSEVDATRMRDQGLGVGQRDMDRQRDPTRAVEDRSFQSTEDIGDPDEPASGQAQQGANHRRWDTKDEMNGQGPKTLAKQRDQIKGQG